MQAEILRLRYLAERGRQPQGKERQYVSTPSAFQSFSVATHLFRGIILKIRKSLRWGTAISMKLSNLYNNCKIGHMDTSYPHASQGKYDTLKEILHKKKYFISSEKAQHFMLKGMVHMIAM